MGDLSPCNQGVQFLAFDVSHTNVLPLDLVSTTGDSLCGKIDCSVVLYSSLSLQIVSIVVVSWMSL